jgi:hypothetical protein
LRSLEEEEFLGRIKRLTEEEFEKRREDLSLPLPSIFLLFFPRAVLEEATEAVFNRLGEEEKAIFESVLFKPIVYSITLYFFAKKLIEEEIKEKKVYLVETVLLIGEQIVLLGIAAGIAEKTESRLSREDLLGVMLGGIKIQRKIVAEGKEILGRELAEELLDFIDGSEKRLQQVVKKEGLQLKKSFFFTFWERALQNL